MTIAIGVAINERKLILYYHRPRKIKSSLWQRVKNSAMNVMASLVAPNLGYGVA